MEGAAHVDVKLASSIDKMLEQPGRSMLSLRLSFTGAAEQAETSKLKPKAISIESSLDQSSHRRKSSVPFLVKDDDTDQNRKERLTVSAETSPSRRRFKSQSPSAQEAKGVIFRHSKEVFPAPIPRISPPVERLSMSTILEKIGRRKQRKSAENLHVSMGLTFSGVVLRDLLKDIPLLPLSFIDSDAIVRRGPTQLDEHTPQNASYEGGRWAMSGQSISTYPTTMTQGQKLMRDGDPICDSYVAQLHNSSAILCLTDGCGWGMRPRDASHTACNRFTEYIHNHLSEVKDSHALAKLLFHGLVEAHYKVISGNDDAGTTTILGGVIVPIGEQDGLSLFIFISVGDCKAYCRKASSGIVVDLSVETRTSAFDAKDPGGRIGPHNPDKMPDLRNLTIDFRVCEAGDIIILVSDGVSDNFDPEYNGLMPLDLGMPESDWKSVQDKEYVAKCKSQWSCVKIAQLINTVEVSPESIVRVLLDYCVVLTKPSRDFLENVRVEKLPSDYVKYPGKMDHTTCLAIRIQNGT